MEGNSFACNCGITISRRKDRTTHEKTQKHLLAIQQRKETQAVINEREDCTHYWKIDSSNGPHSNGYCLHCGSQRQFANSVEVNGHWGGSTGGGKRSFIARQNQKTA